MAPRKRSRKPKRTPKTQTFSLRSKQLRTAVNDSIQEAKRAVAAGEKALGSARRRQDAKASRNSAKMLGKTRKALRGLQATLRALKAVCCDQFLNCDPAFKG